jgi:2-amino-4-hydroxy-6-hydroxymethyldihydropteridine diphosphokinase
MHKVFLGIGGNLGNKSENFRKAFSMVGENLGKIAEFSSVYESPPWGFHAENNFWNQVLIIETECTPQELLNKIHTIEKAFGRVREKKEYDSREMDIDILYYDELLMDTGTLVIPHPHIQKRLFVLIPLAEIAAGFKHPLLRLTSKQMLENCRDRSVIKKVEIGPKL